MATTSKPANEHVSALRAFNRFYTTRLGLLRKRHLDGEFSLTEARVLYEIASNPQLTASSLCELLELHAGYMSRLLAALARRKLISQKASKQDGREKLLGLSATGKEKVAKLEEESGRQIQMLLAPLSDIDRSALIESLTKAHTILRQRTRPQVRIVRVHTLDATALQLIEDYYEAVDVVLRDSPDAIQQIIDEPGGGMWVAYLQDRAAGCVMVKALDSIPSACECKRLYVQPVARGNRIAEKLMDALEAHAAEQGFKWIYLDTYDDLKPAIALYMKRGYEPCKRYNENPQATVFFRKGIEG